jgi:hypothetical protein
MLEVIGAGTASAESVIDFHVFYKESALFETNAIHIDALCLESENIPAASTKHDEKKYQTSLLHQLRWVGYKVTISYWRTPSYNFARMLISILIALIFASAYPNQRYHSDTQTIARSAVIYVTWYIL